jgi:protein gp37
LPDDFLKFGPRVWLICSGEQGSRARPMNPDWTRALLAQCREADVPFFMNQMSRRTPIPHDLFVREFPAVGFANPFKKCEDVA